MSVLVVLAFFPLFTAPEARPSESSEKPASTLINDYDLSLNIEELDKIFSEYVATNRYSKYPRYLSVYNTLVVYKWDKPIEFVTYDFEIGHDAEKVIKLLSNNISNIFLVNKDDPHPEDTLSELSTNGKINIVRSRNYRSIISENSELLFSGPEGNFDISASDFLDITRNKYCHMSFYIKDNSVDSAIYLENADTPPAISAKCLAIFIYRSLGIFGSNFVRYDSIINPNTDRADLSQIDLDVIRALYASNVKSGASMKEFEKAMLSIVIGNQ